MLTPTYSCVRCGCQAAARNATLVEAMGWRVLAAGGGEPSIACLCAVCAHAARRPVTSLSAADARSGLRWRDADAGMIS